MAQSEFPIFSHSYKNESKYHHTLLHSELINIYHLWSSTYSLIFNKALAPISSCFLPQAIIGEPYFLRDVQSIHWTQECLDLHPCIFAFSLLTLLCLKLTYILHYEQQLLYTDIKSLRTHSIDTISNHFLSSHSHPLFQLFNPTETSNPFIHLLLSNLSTPFCLPLFTCWA